MHRVEYRLWAGFLVILILTASILFMDRWQSRQVMEAQSWVAHTHEVVAAIKSVVSEFKDAERGQRGYLLTMKPEFLNPYIEARSAYNAQLDHLQLLTSDNPYQQQKISEFRSLANKMFRELNQTIEMAKMGQRDAAIKRVAKAHGNDLMKQIRALAGIMNDEESRLLNQRLTRFQRLSDNLQWGTAICVASATLADLLVAFVTIRSIRAQYLRQSVFTELAQANQDLEQFAYAASHDLRSPLRGIATAAEIICEEESENISEESQKCLSMMKLRIARMETLLDDLLAYSRANQHDEPKEIVDVHHLVEEVVQMSTLPDGFEVQIQNRLPVMKTSIAPLRQVFLNLISNAVKHHDRECGRIQIRSQQQADTVVFRCCDDGPGIDAEYRERVFEMFETLKSHDESEGSGLGLAMVKRHISRLGGEVSIEPNQPRGCKFVFQVPYIAAPVESQLDRLPQNDSAQNSRQDDAEIHSLC